MINTEDTGVGEELLLKAASAETTEDCETKEAESEDHEQTKDGPLDLLSSDKSTEGVINLVLGPYRLALDISEWEEPSIVTWHSEVEKLIAIDSHVEEDTLHGNHADT